MIKILLEGGHMKKLRILKGILKRTYTDHILIAYVIFVFLDAMFIFIVEPGITNYGDALWFCYAVLSTAGFGDIVAVTLLGKLASVLLTVYSLVVIAIITGVIVNYYMQIIQIRQKESLAAVLNDLERLEEMSKEDLAELSQRIRKLRESDFPGQKQG